MRRTDGWRRGARTLALALGSLLVVPLTLAGTIDVRWDAVAASDLAGYRVYYGTTPGSHANTKDVGNTTSTQLTALADCTIHYASVRAYDTGGLESNADSNSVKGYPRPVVTTVSPATINAGQTVTFTITGTNYDAGVNGDSSRPRAQLQLSHPGLTITSYTVDACGTIHMTVQAASGATSGFSDVTVKNPDLSTSTPASKPWVFGLKSSAIEVKGTSDTTAPTVTSTDPAAGATGVAATVHPSVTFSEPMNSATVTASTVRLIDVATGNALTQAPGSPALSGTVATITPSSALGAGKQYRIQVTGGGSGVKDLAGNGLASTYTQSPPFTIATDGGSSGELSITSWSPAAGTPNVVISTTQVRIVFNKDVSALFTILDRAELQKRFRVTSGATALPQTAGSPSTENSGRTVVITLAKPLTAMQAYSTEAKLGGGALKKKLTDAGRPDLLGENWKCSPAWVVEEPIESSAFRSPTSGDTGPLTPGSSTTADGNSGVPVDAEFRVTYQTTLQTTSVNIDTVKIYAVKGDTLKLVPLAGYPTVEGGRTIVTRPASPLDPGKKYRLWLKAGAQGILMTVSNGAAATKGKAQVINFTTEVSAAAQSETLAIGAEPSATIQDAPDGSGEEGQR